MFYVDYPSTVQSGSLPRAILASIVFSELEKFQNLTGFRIVLNTAVTPRPVVDPNDNQRANAVILTVADFSEAQVRIFLFVYIFFHFSGMHVTFSSKNLKCPCNEISTVFFRWDCRGRLTPAGYGTFSPPPPGSRSGEVKLQKI